MKRKLCLLLAVLAALTGCGKETGFKTLGGGEYGVLFYKLPRWSMGGVSNELIQPGKRVFIFPWEKLYVVDTNRQTIGWGGTGQGDTPGVEDYVETRALDGNEVGLAVTVIFHVDREKAAYVVQKVGDTKEKVRDFVAAVAHADIRTHMNTLNTWDFANQHERQRAVARVTEAMNARMRKEGIVIDDVIYVDHRFERALGEGRYDRSYQEKIDQTQATNQETQQERKKIAAVVEDKRRLLNEEQARVNRALREVEGRKQQATLRGDSYLSAKKQEAEQVRLVGMSEIESLRKRIEALSGPGGQALVKMELVEQLLKNNPKFVLIKSSGEGKGGLDLTQINANDLLLRAGIVGALSEGAAARPAPPPAPAGN